jgi:membrane protease YdiL (CAAX protease family)
MKKCAYCGRENTDDANFCCACGNPEFATPHPAPAQAILEATTQEISATTAPAEPVAEETRPLCERWRPRSAWSCLLTTVLVLIFATLLLLATTAQTKWRGFHSREDMGVGIILSCIIPFAVTLCFSGVRTMRAFKESFAFIPISEEQVALAAATGFLIQTVTIYVFEGGLAHLELRSSFSSYVVAALLAPFLEEPVFRGFLYKAFRNRYPAWTSTILVVGMALLFHGRPVFHLHGAIAIGLLNLAACILRERSGSLWPPIICHLAFNAIPAATS